MEFWNQFPQNRYLALDEVQRLLGFNAQERQHFLKILRKANDGYIEFNLGHLKVQFAIWSEDEKRFHLYIEFTKGTIGKSITYEYNLEELEALSNKTQLEIERLKE